MAETDSTITGEGQQRLSPILMIPINKLTWGITMEYQLEIKQIVDYPRCSIYREFIRSLIADKDLHINVPAMGHL